MAESATILIPDISGFTEFTSSTELDHAAHIINELLEIIIASNEMGFTLAEIEGDAVLFYLKQDDLDLKEIVGQCLAMFRNFHSRLMVIERDTVCQCGACQSVTNLTLKFIVHHGEIKEIKVAHFVKATGVDMIVAHRLLKNAIPSDEYILITERCIACSNDNLPPQEVTWSGANETYVAIGNVEFQYAVLSDYRSGIPAPAPREEFVEITGDDHLELDIESSVFNVYQTLIDVDKRKDWMLGVDKIHRDPVTERIGMQHNCQFMGMIMTNTCLDHSYNDRDATYIERVEVPDMSIDTVDIYEMLLLASDKTHLKFHIDWKETPLPPEQKQGMMQGIKANLESLKRYIEGHVV